MFKNIVITVILGMLTFIPVQTCGQTQKEVAKERKAINKLSQSELNKKASKAARKDAKKFAKEGWIAKRGILPLDKQLDRLYSMQYAYDENYPKYQTSTALSIAETYEIAKMQALTLAHLELASKIKHEAIVLINNLVADDRELENLLRQIILSVSVDIGHTITVLELYRIEDNQEKEVLVSIACNSDMAFESLKKEVYKVLEKQNNEFANQWDKFFRLYK
jgi:hypothetical protein